MKEEDKEGDDTYPSHIRDIINSFQQRIGSSWAKGDEV